MTKLSALEEILSILALTQVEQSKDNWKEENDPLQPGVRRFSLLKEETSRTRIVWNNHEQYWEKQFFPMHVRLPRESPSPYIRIAESTSISSGGNARTQ